MKIIQISKLNYVQKDAQPFNKIKIGYKKIPKF